MKQIQKCIAILLVVWILLCSAAVSAAAAGDTIKSATQITMGQRCSGTISESHATEYYKFTLNESGNVRIQLTAFIHITMYYLYDENAELVWQCGDTAWLGYYGEEWNPVSEKLDRTWNLDLTGGTYYFCISHVDGEGEYTFQTQFAASRESFPETTGGTNNTIASAVVIETDNAYHGQIALNDEKDYFSFTLAESGCVNIQLTAYIYRTMFYLYDEKAEIVWQCGDTGWMGYDGEEWNPVSERLDRDWNFDLTAGTYYFCVSRYDGEGNYNFSLHFTSANESFSETAGGSNNTIATAVKIETDKDYRGQIALNDEKDYYRFTLSKSDTIKIQLTAYIYRSMYCLYNEKADLVWQCGDIGWMGYDGEEWNSELKQLDREWEFDLTAGTYFFCVSKYEGGGNYVFNIHSTSATAFTLYYNSNADKVRNMPDAQTGAATYTVSSTVPVRDGYTFLGWSADAAATSASYRAGDSITLTQDTTLYAIWEKIPTASYTVVYNANGGTVTPESATVTAGNSVTLPRPQKAFTITYDANGGTGAPPVQTCSLWCTGWSESPDTTSSSYACGTRYTPSGSTTLYAVWPKDTGTWLSDDEPKRDGCTFLGWARTKDAKKADFAAGSVVTLKANVTVYAVWDVEYDPNAKLDVKTPSIVWSTQWDRLATCAFSITGSEGEYSFNARSSNEQIVQFTNEVTDLGDNIIGLSLKAKKAGNAVITLELYNKTGTVLIDTYDVPIDVTNHYYTDSIRMDYSMSEVLQWEDFEPIRFQSEDERIVTVNEKTGLCIPHRTGTGYVEAIDAYGNYRVTEVEVYYTFFQWIVYILFLGWLWF